MLRLHPKTIISYGACSASTGIQNSKFIIGELSNNVQMYNIDRVIIIGQVWSMRFVPIRVNKCETRCTFYHVYVCVYALLSVCIDVCMYAR